MVIGGHDQILTGEDGKGNFLSLHGRANGWQHKSRRRAVRSEP